jgi:hypothetical protein
VYNDFVIMATGIGVQALRLDMQVRPFGSVYGASPMGLWLGAQADRGAD